MDGLQVEIAGMGGLTMKHFLFGFGGESPDGRLHAWVDLGLDELASPSLPPKVAAFLPHHVEIKPSLSGVLTADLHKLALDATEEGADSDSLAPDIAAIFSHGGVDLGIETLSFDLGPAKVEGTGQLTALSPDTWHGEAHLVATGLDDLATQARTQSRSAAGPAGADHAARAGEAGRQAAGVGHRERWSDGDGERPRPVADGRRRQAGRQAAGGEAWSEAEPVKGDLPLGAVLQFQAGRHTVAGKGRQTVARQVGAARIGQPDLGVPGHPAQPRQDVRGHRRLVADVAAQDQVPAAVGADDVVVRDGDGDAVRRGIQRDRCPRQTVDLGGFDRCRAGQGAGDGGDAAAGSEVEHAPAGDDRDGWSSTWRASAWPPGQANAQNGGSTSCSASQASVACQIGVISLAR